MYTTDNEDFEELEEVIKKASKKGIHAIDVARCARALEFPDEEPITEGEQADQSILEAVINSIGAGWTDEQIHESVDRWIEVSRSK
jgi:methionine synthase II (cobalamin-independent)